MGCTGGTRKEKGRRRAEWYRREEWTDGKKGIVIPQDSSYNNMEETSCGKPQGERSGKHV